MTEPIAPKSPALEAAEIAKLEAEAASLKVEAVKNQAIALKESHQAAISGITLEERRRVEQLTLVQDHYVFHHAFDGVVGEASVYGCLNTMHAWHRLYPGSDWSITINSPGGSVIHGMHLFDQIVAYSKRGGGEHKITITVRGYAASMAGILLQAADVRRIGPESFLMIHEISSVTGGKIGDMKDDMKWYEKVCERIVDVFVKRAKEAAENNPVVKGITPAVFKKGWERTDWWIDSEESLRLGFVDEIG